MTVGLLARLVPLLVLGACSPGDSGALRPTGGPDVTLVSTHGLPDDTARLTRGGVRADVTGRWSNENESIDVVYVASAPGTIAIASTSTWNGNAAPASNAWDVSVKEPGNAVGRPLLESGGLRLASGDRHTVPIDYGRSGDRRPRLGDEVTITVPMPNGAQSVRFRLVGE